MGQFSYRKKPFEVEAWRFSFSPPPGAVPDWFNAAIKLPKGSVGSVEGFPHGGAHGDEALTSPHMVMFTPKGPMVAEPGDWIVQDENGDLYPCKNDVFDATYERVL